MVPNGSSHGRTLRCRCVTIRPSPSAAPTERNSMASKQGERYSPIVAPLLRTDRHTPRRSACPTDRHPPPPARSPAPAWHARDVRSCRGGGPGESSPRPGCAMLARGLVVQLGRAMHGGQARMSDSPPRRRSRRSSHSRLTACPATPPAGHWRWSVVGCAFGACCFAGKLRSPAGSGPVPPWPRPSTPTLDPTPATRVPPVPPGRRIAAGDAPPRGSGTAAPQGALRALD
jgi:hypothetical protein